MRANVYKEKILTVLKKSHLLSIPSIQEKITNADFSTIFRNLEQLCKEDIVRKVIISKDTILYEVVQSDNQHDHFVCTDCGTIESIHLPQKNISSGTVTDILVRGMCNNCIK